ncbi:Na/Pi cotransporter family protein [Cognataquiflexum rubidum]|uniref:Na/Pi cotransporter family protein n=1 Tax=Cognataquiflexum rubidum TaxID=2922273 RepID=UPI001F1378A6|nr:Na/Pi symporter [Cognataquiflexum rubidum]MCH6233012.1 Na/Pi symporter [Cognataquiflexum rubidum]
MDQIDFDFWKFFAGIGIFLWGIFQLENAIKELGGNSFRQLLHRFTDAPWKGILIGTLVTALLQSSSLVTLMVLAFLGAGVLNLKNALGVVLGANLGTTATAWIVATLGFKLSVEAFSFPFLGIGSLMFLFFKDRPYLKNFGAISIGFGLLFLGLDFMKTSIEEIADGMDMEKFQGYGSWFYLIAGLVITAVMQSSSAAIVIVLSTMNAGMIGLTEGAAMVIGANIGTTVTLGIGSLGGTADKKRLAFAHFLFNVVTGLLIFLFLDWVIDFTMKVFEIHDPLMELVLFNTFLNAVGIILFYPFITQLERVLKMLFKKDEPQGLSKFIKNVSPKLPSVALEALEKEILLAYDSTVNFIMNVLENGELEENNKSIWRKILYQPVNLLEEYGRIKKLEDEITKYHIFLQEEFLNEKEAQKLTSLMLSLRTMVFAAKDIKDVMHNIRDMEGEEDRLVVDLHGAIKTYVTAFLEKMDEYKALEVIPEKEPDWINENAKQYKIWISELYEDLKSNNLEFPISTLTNVIKQVISSMDNLGSSVIHWKHQKKEVIDVMP